MNSSTGEKERIGRIVRLHANSREDVQEVYAGEIAAAIGLKGTRTGHTICDERRPVVLESITFPEPVIDIAIEPKTKQDQEKMGIALQKLAEEDPTFRVHTDDETLQTIISGMGELHLDIIVDRMKREFGVGANVGAPRVAYKETIRQAAEGEGNISSNPVVADNTATAGSSLNLKSVVKVLNLLTRSRAPPSRVNILLRLKRVLSTP